MKRTAALLLALMLVLSGCLGGAKEEIDPNDMFPEDDAAYYDTDGDGMPDTLEGESSTGLTEDLDDDNDGYTDVMEASCGTDPLDDASTPPDLDGDKACDDYDEDDDGDGTPDLTDDFPRDASADTDTDGDGMPNVVVGTSTSDPALVEDLDDDNDGWSDLDEAACGTNPLVASLKPMDNDGDGVCDSMSTDDDGDGVSDEEEGLCGSDPLDATSLPADLDNDGICDALDEDDDDDGVNDSDDLYPRDPSKSEDLPGCMDENAFNFDDEANMDDGSCFDLSDAEAAAEAAYGAGLVGIESLDDGFLMRMVVDAATGNHQILMALLGDDGSELFVWTYTDDGSGMVQVDRLMTDDDGFTEEASFLVDGLYYLGMGDDEGGWSHCEQDGETWYCTDLYDENDEQVLNGDSATDAYHLFTCDDQSTVLLSVVDDGVEDCADGSDEPDIVESTTYTCDDGSEIAFRLVNDGDEDCADGSDEELANWFYCADGSWDFHFSAVNDGWADCEDGSDEPMYDLDALELSTYACEDGTTVLLSKVRDGTNDCADGTDEQPTTGEMSEMFHFPCDGDMDGDDFIPLSLVNDGTEDCTNGEDEPTYDGNGDETSTYTCWDYFAWEASSTIALSAVNDGVVDCWLHDDETNYETDNAFWCPFNGEPYVDLPWTWVNDGTTDCDDASDEPSYDGNGNEDSTITCWAGDDIPLSWANDGMEDCTEGDDEPIYTMEVLFECVDGDIIGFNWVNDGYEDCADGSDEPQWDMEELSSFACDDGSVIGLSAVNDGWDDCANAEDEPNWVEEEVTSFDCASGDVIPLSYVNDGMDDCPAGDDEPTYDPITQSETSFYQCPYSGESIALSLVNDGNYDCEDWEDEPYFEEYDDSEWWCDDGQYSMPISYVNNGWEDCEDGSDEPEWDMGEDISVYTCANGEEITNSQVNDGVEDCSDASDEVKTFECADGSYEFDWGAVNDGWEDCDDGSDESDAEDISSVDCMDGSSSLPVSFFYDGWEDCDDGWDEMWFESQVDCAWDDALGWLCEELMFDPSLGWTASYEEDDDGTMLLLLTALEEDGEMVAGFDATTFDFLFMESTWTDDEGAEAYEMLWTEAYDASLAEAIAVDGTLDEHAPPWYIDFSGDAMPVEDTRVFVCDDGSEIEGAAINDGVEDCANGEDEPVYEDVEWSEFYCSADDEWIPFSWVNDGTADCSDGEDEPAYDGNGDEVSTLECWSGDVIALSLANDGNEDCPDGDDEPQYYQEDVSEWWCDDGEYSIPVSYVNDGGPDCQDGSDEAPEGEGHGFGVYRAGTVGMAAWGMGEDADMLEVTFFLCSTFEAIDDVMGEQRYTIPSDCGDEVARYTFDEIMAGEVTGLEWVDDNGNGVLDEEDFLYLSEDFELTDWNAMRLSTPDGLYADENPEVVLPAPGMGLAVVALLGAAMLAARRD